MKPATFLWFAAHDTRLALRRVHAFFGKPASRAKIVSLLGLALVLFHALAWGAAQAAVEHFSGGFRALYPTVATAMLFILPWIVSQALTNATRALYSRGDLDIVLASPMSPRPVFAARACAIALESILSVAIFILPLANMMALVAGWRWLAIYPTLVAAGLFGAGIGLFLTLALFRLCGPRRTRTVANIFATIIGAAFALGLQAYNIAPMAFRAHLERAIGGSHVSGLLDPDSALWIPVRAAAGEPRALVVWTLVSIAVFALAAFTLAGTFARGVVATVGAEAAAGARRSTRPIRFHGGVGVSLRLKEWRLLVRDPQLASQIFLQIVYTTPISVVLWRAMGPDASLALAAAPALVAIASNVSASLAWLTISSEDAPEFLATAPVTRREVERRKLEAIVLPLAVLCGAPVTLIFLTSWKGGLVTLFYVVCAAVSTALLNLWQPAPSRRGDLFRRHSQSKLVGMIEHLLSLFWALALALTAFESEWALACIACAVGVLMTQKPKGRMFAVA
jgi:ABC-2 type transport system permease protein